MLHNLFQIIKKREANAKFPHNFEQNIKAEMNRRFHDYAIKTNFAVNETHVIEYAKLAALGSEDAITTLCKEFNKLQNPIYGITPNRDAKIKWYYNALMTVCEKSVYPTKISLIHVLFDYFITLPNITDPRLNSLLNASVRIADAGGEESIDACYTLAIYFGDLPLSQFYYTLNELYDENIKNVLETDDKMKVALKYAKEGSSDAIKYILNKLSEGLDVLNEERYQSEEMKWLEVMETKREYREAQCKYYLRRSIDLALEFNVIPKDFSSFKAFFNEAILLYSEVAKIDNIAEFEQSLINQTINLARHGNANAAWLVYQWYQEGYHNYLDIEPNQQEANKWLDHIISLNHIPLSGKAIQLKYRNEFLLPIDSTKNRPGEDIFSIQQKAAELGNINGAVFMAASATVNNDFKEIDKWLLQAYHIMLLQDVRDPIMFEEVIKQAVKTSSPANLDQFFPYYLKWHTLLALLGNEQSCEHMKYLYYDHLNRTYPKECPEKVKLRANFKTVVKKMNTWGETNCYLTELMHYIQQTTFPVNDQLTNTFKELRSFIKEPGFKRRWHIRY